MKKTIAILAVLIVAAACVFATRVGITYNGVDYVLATSVPITQDDVGYFNAFYDGFAALKQGYPLYKLYEMVQAKAFANDEKGVQKAGYEAGFMDFMNNYSYGSIGKFKDIYPLFKMAVSSPFNYENAKKVVYYGDARFYLTDI